MNVRHADAVRHPSGASRALLQGVAMRTCSFAPPRLHFLLVACLCLLLALGVGGTQTRCAARNLASATTPALDQGRCSELPPMADGDDDGDLEPPDSAGWAGYGTFGHEAYGEAALRAMSSLARLDGVTNRLSGHLVMRA
jgi:hypothetical protein